MRPGRRHVAPGLLLLLFLAAVLAWLFFGPHFYRPPSSVSANLQPRLFAEIPGWKTTNSLAALAAFRRSCTILQQKPDVTPMGVAGYAGRAGEWKQVCLRLPEGPLTADLARAFFETNFAAAEVVGPRPLFTGYYEPLLNASRKRQGRFQQPVYGPPENLVRVDLGLFRPQFAGEHLDGCVSGGRLLPCPTRAEIDAAPPARAPVLLYTDDPVALFFLHVQGSGRARLADGGMLRLSYAGQNGQPYTPIGKVLLERGLLDRARLSMQTIRDWLYAHPKLARPVMESDRSYVFFNAGPLGDPRLGSKGSEGVPLTPKASIAIDGRVHPFGVPVYLVGEKPGANSGEMRSMASLFIAQDTGGAIRGAARADIFWGFGKEAEAIAGRMRSGGRFFLLLPKAAGHNLPRALPSFS